MSGHGRTAAPEPALTRALVALCVTEITSWGVLYYAFPVLLGSLTADTGWSLASAMGAFSAGLGVSAVAGVPVGRLLDRLGPRPVMTAGSVLGAVAVVGIALAPGPGWFTAAWMFAGLAQAAVLYQPAFAALTHWYGPRRVRALTILTLAAGLASTVFAPVTAYLLEHHSWRTVYLILGAVLAVVTIPLHALLLSPPWHSRPVGPDRARADRRHVRAVLRSRAFLVLTAVIAVANLGLMAAVVNLVPLLVAGGMPNPVAAWALGLNGAGQLLGRIGYHALVRVTTVTTRTVGVLLFAGLSTAALGLVAGPVVAVIAVAVVAGAARGLFTLLAATAVSDRWGTRQFGTLNGVVGAPLTAAMAVAPWAGAAAAAQLGSYPVTFVLVGGLIVAAAVGSLAATPRPPP